MFGSRRHSIDLQNYFSSSDPHPEFKTVESDYPRPTCPNTILYCISLLHIFMAHLYFIFSSAAPGGPKQQGGSKTSKTIDFIVFSLKNVEKAQFLLCFEAP